MVMNKKGNIKECIMFFLQGYKKRGQQSSFGMSFGMIFSIILIIVFIGAAIYVITIFLGLTDAFSYGQFYTDLQSEVDSAWKGSGGSSTMDMNLPGDIEYICFANLSAPITEDDIYFMIGQYAYTDLNTFMIPPEPAGQLAAMNIKHLDIGNIIESANPYCIDNPGEIRISKGVRSKYVTLG